MAATYIGTTHGGGGKGGGPKVRHRRFAWPAPRDRRLPQTGNMAPWFLKQPLSRPAHKRPRRLDAVA